MTSSSSFALQDQDTFNEHQVLLPNHQQDMDRSQNQAGGAYEIK